MLQPFVLLFLVCYYPLVSFLSVSAAHSVSEDGQNDQYTESINSPHSSSSSPAARYHHGNSLTALSSSQVVNRKWVCVGAAAMAIAVQTRPGLCLPAETPGWFLPSNIKPHMIKCWTILNVSVIILFYVFYYRIDCYWMWLHIRRYSGLFAAWCGVAWLFSKSVCMYIWTATCIDYLIKISWFSHSNIPTVQHFNGHIYWT